jgi:4-hydroxy-tetrahydrodipicolinate synthase
MRNVVRVTPSFERRIDVNEYASRITHHASLLSGVIPALVTPFGADGAVDEGSLRRAVAHQVEAGADGLLILGLAGEGIYLSVAERERVAAVVAEAAGGLPLLVGCTADTTEDAVRLVANAAAHGASGVMVAPPRKPEWTREQFRAHYRAVAEASSCEVMVQDAPFAIGVELGVELVLELAEELPTLRAYKVEALPFWENAVRARTVAGDRLRLFGGHGGLYLLDVLDAGAAGLIPGCDVTADLARAWDAYQADDRASAERDYLRLLPFLVFEAQSMALLVGAAKTLLHQRGVIASTRTRIPGGDLSGATRERLLLLARQAGVV